MAMIERSFRRPIFCALLFALLVLSLAQGVQGVQGVQGAPRWSPTLKDAPVGQKPAFWLAKGGKPQATIVIAENPVDSNRMAAELLQESIQKISGATLPIVDDSKPIAGPVIYIGRSKAVDAMKLDIPAGYTRALDEEGYLIKTTGDQLVLVGNDNRPNPPYKGSLYATVEVLERLGCRWYMPGDFGAVYPRSADVCLPQLDERVKPAFPVRGFWYGTAPALRDSADLKRDMERWQAVNRFQPYGSVLASASDGSIMSAFTKSGVKEQDGKKVRVNAVFEEHPEWFALNKDGTRNSEYLCLSNPAVLERLVEQALAHFQKNPEALAFSIAPPDGAPTCECKDCREKNQMFMQKEPSDPRIQDISGGFYYVLNELAKRVKEKYPEKWITSTAYSGRIRPPENLQLSDNISLHTALLAHSRHHRYDSPTWQTQERVQIYKRWGKLSNAVVEREYYPVFQFTLNLPLPMLRSSAYNYRLIKEIGLRGAEWEGRTSFFSESATNYVRGQLLWNLDTDVEALLEDYYTRFYGKAGPVVSRFDEAVENTMTQSMVDHHEEERIPEVFPHDVVVRITDAVGEVEKLVSDADTFTRQRVAYFRMEVDHFRAYSEMRYAETQLDFKRAAEQAQAMIDIESKVNKINLTFIDSYLAHFDSKPMYGEMGGNASAQGKLRQYRAKQKLIDGTGGTLVAALPIAWQFKPDPYDRGVVFEWHRVQANDSGWRDMNTTASWEIQGMQDETAQGYNGYGWYRTTFDVPESFKGKPMRLFIGGMNNQAWVWINNKLAVAVPYHDYWQRWKYHADVDISGYIEAGKTNQIAIRVWNDQNAGGLFRRSFVYSPIGTEK